MAEIRQRHRLRILEESIADRIEERHEISEALSDCGIDSKERLRYESHVLELGLEVVRLWYEYRKLAIDFGYTIADVGLF